MCVWTIFERIWAKTVHNLCVVTNIFFSNLSLRFSFFMLLLLRYFSEIKKKYDASWIISKLWWNFKLFFSSLFLKNFSTIFYCSIGSILLIMPHSNFPFVQKKKKNLVISLLTAYLSMEWFGQVKEPGGCVLLFLVLCITSPFLPEWFLANFPMSF